MLVPDSNQGFSDARVPGPDRVLVLDVGNSAASAAIASRDASVSGRQSVPTSTIRTGGLEKLIEKTAGAGTLTGAIMCSVVPELVEPCLARLRAIAPEALLLDERLPTGMRIDYQPPSDLGPDRIANAVGLRALCNGPACAVDLGTATSFDVISADGAFAGGAIAPGLEVSSSAMFSAAARLAHPGWEPPPAALGKSTEQCLRSGIVFGYASMVDGMIERLEEEVGAFNRVIATGGLAGTMIGVSKRVTHWRPLLTLEGLAAAYRAVTEGTV